MKIAFWIIIVTVVAVIAYGGFFYWGNLRGAWPILGTPENKIDLIRVNEPRPNSQISSPLVVEGEARGYWFFEASFPVRVLDGDGKELGVGIAQAQREWMTEDFVPFRATVNFKTSQFETGTLVLEKDNPSGLPENADELRIPIKFKSTDKTPSGECFVGGCSGEICSDKNDAVSICVWREEYACYKNAKCERQPSGECSWTQTPELASCLNGARAPRE